MTLPTDRSEYGLSISLPVGSVAALDAEIWISEMCSKYALKHSEGHWDRAVIVDAG
jgi:hypothetical protein